MGIYSGNLFDVDWSDFEEVKKVADDLGEGQSIVWNEKHGCYNIVHTGHEGGREVVYRTKVTLH